VFGIVFSFYIYTGFMGAKVAVSAAHGAPPPPPTFADASGAALGDMTTRINAIEARRASELQGVSKSWSKAKKRDGGGNSWHEQQERAALAGVNAKYDKQVKNERTQSTEAVAVLSNNTRAAGNQAAQLWTQYVTITEGSKQKESGLYSWATVAFAILNALFGVLIEIEHKKNGTDGGNKTLGRISNAVLSLSNALAKFAAYILELPENLVDRLPEIKPPAPAGQAWLGYKPGTETEIQRLRRNAATAKSQGYADRAERLLSEAAALEQGKQKL
jgi:hypothetical protein